MESAAHPKYATGGIDYIPMFFGIPETIGSPLFLGCEHMMLISNFLGSPLFDIFLGVAPMWPKNGRKIVLCVDQSQITCHQPQPDLFVASYMM